jgi:hypothetical protein
MRAKPSPDSLCPSQAPAPRGLKLVTAKSRSLSWPLHIPAKLGTCEKLYFLPNTDKRELHKNLNINLPKMKIS